MAFTSSGPAFRKVCSQNMITSTAEAKRRRSRAESASPGWVSAVGVGRGGAERGRRASRAGAARARCPSQRPGHDQSDRSGAAPSRSRPRTARRQATDHHERRTSSATSPRRRRIRRRGERLVAGQEAAREVRRGVSQHRADQHPVERGSSRSSSLSFRGMAQRQRQDRGTAPPQGELDRRRHSQVLVPGPGRARRGPRSSARAAAPPGR